jgi:hypothetical protein
MGVWGYVDVHRFRVHDRGMVRLYLLLYLIYGVCVFYYVRYRILSLHDVTQRHVRPYSNMLRVGNTSVLA